MQNIDTTIVNNFFSIVTVDQSFSDQTIKPLIHEIAKKEQGSLLLERLIKIGRHFKILSHSVTATFPNLNLVQVEPIKPYFYVAMKDGEKFLLEAPRYVRLAHELIHLVHAYENPKLEKQRGLNLTDDGTDNEEERLTIFGYNHLETDPCSENSFLAREGLPLRINHEGPETLPPTLIDVIKVGALGTLKEILREDPSLINFVGYCFEANSTSSLLSAAAYYNHEDIIDFLLAKETDIHTKDEIGGPILAALKNDHKELALSLIKRGLDTSLKDHNQMTALDLLNSRPRARFDMRTKPILNLLNQLAA